MSIPIVRQLMVQAVLLLAVLLQAVLLSSSAALAEEIEISGQVRGRAGGLADARIELHPLLSVGALAARQLAGTPEPVAVAKTRSDRDGELRLISPAPGFWRVLVRHPDYLPAIHDLSPLLAPIELAELALQRKSELVVRVRDSEGEVVAGIPLTARGWSEPWRQAARSGWWPADRQVQTRADGIAAIACAPLEKVSIATVVEGRFIYRVADCDLSLLELELEEPREARVLHDGGAPAAGVYGLLRWPLLAFGASDEDGHLSGPFDWRGSAPVVFADPAGFYGEPRRVGPGGDGEGGDGEQAEQGGEVLLLPPSIAVAGQVIDAVDGRPVPGAWMWVGRGSWHHQRTERGGAFETLLPTAVSTDSGHADRSVLHFGAPGYLTIRHAPSAEEAADLVVRLSPTLTLSGRVVDSVGASVDGAVIRGEKPRALRLGAPSRKLQGAGQWVLGDIAATSGADGTFELGGLAPSTPLKLRVTRSGFAAHTHRVPGLDPGLPTDELIITLEAGRSAFGQVISEHGMPIPGAQVALLPSLTGAAAEQDFEVKENFGASTDAEGVFALHDLPLGTYYLSAKGQGFPELLVPGIEISGGEPPLDLGTMILVPGVLLSGRVVDDQGEAVAGAQLSIRNADGEQIVVQRAGSPWFAAAASRQNGSFHFEGLPRASRLTMVVVADGYLPQSLAVTTSEEDQRLEIELSAGAWLAGEVRDARGGPAAGAEVIASSGPGLRQLSKWLSRSADADDDGRFEIAGLPPGDYDIEAVWGNQRAEPIRRVVTAEGLSGLHLQLQEKSSLTVTLRDPAGLPVAEGLVIAVPEVKPAAGAGGSRFFQATDRLGGAVLEPLNGGSYQVSVQHRDFVTLSTVVEMPAQGVERVELNFEQRREETLHPISGLVIDPAGLPVAGARVGFAFVQSADLSSASWSLPSTLSGPDGRFELAAPAGEHRLSCRHEGYVRYVGDLFSLGEAGVSDLRVQLQEGVDVVGRVTGLAQEELVRLVIVARGPFAEGGRLPLGQQYGAINFAGELRIPDLASGRWQVRAELLNPTRSAVEWVEIGRGSGEVSVDLHFEDGYHLSGSVHWRGTPLTGSTVSVRCAGEFRGETFTDAEGRFAIDDVPAGSCTLRAIDAERGLRGRQELEVTFDADVVLEMAEPAGAGEQGL